MNTHYYDKIADLMLYAISIKPGDKIQFTIEHDLREPAKRFVKKAYAKGAAYVALNYRDAFMHAEAIRGNSDSFYFPDYILKKDLETIQPGWKYIHYLNETEGDVYEGLDSSRSSAYFKQLGELKKPRMNAVTANTIPWSLTYFPSEAMAAKAFPELPVSQAVDRYWEAIIRIMRLDEEDPAAFWDSKLQKDAERSRLLNELELKALRFEGPGTDLTVGINQNARWIGGYDQTPDGERFICNLPTDEIFTTPDWRRVNGRVALTKPFTMQNPLGEVPEEAWFLFEEGRVVDYGAARGKGTLTNLFNTDERARYIGEVALVDPRSPFAEGSIIFHNGLYDENAACHLALGQAYAFTLKEPGEYNSEELKEMGFNNALLHEDMMIGGEDVEVTALLADGTEKPLIKDGVFRI